MNDMPSYARTFAWGSILFGLLAAGCTEVESPTELNPEGPPMVRQVFTNEVVINADTGAVRTIPALAFGSHPDFDPNDDGVVTSGSIVANQKIRVVIDELLIGNYLEQIQCRDGSYQSVPEGATPDDIANCSVQNDVLPQTCTGKYAVCLDSEGLPIGVMDADENGSADDTRFIEGSVRVVCNDGAIDVPLSLSSSFWQPSGNQQVPSSGGFNAVGPAVVLAPALGLPTSSTCTVVFSDAIVDKDHIRVCAPEGGDIANPCDPGDTSRISWGTEGMRVVGSNPPDGSENVALTGSGGNAQIVVQFNAGVEADDARNVDPTGFVLLENGVARTGLTALRDMNNAASVTITVPGGYVAGASYELQVTTDVHDQFGIALPEANERSITFTAAASLQ